MSSVNGFKTTTRRALTRRGVLWLGQTCNLRCHFCYFLTRIRDKEHPEHAFMEIDKAKAICRTLREVYDNRAVDIQGGEPTIYPHIHELTRHCADIGLLPTLITNAVALGSRESCQKLKDAGVRDLLVSIHGLGEAYDQAVGLPGGHKRQMQALEHMQAVGLPFRFNCVLAKSVLPDLSRVARLAVDTGARVVNFIAFNPFEDQQNNTRSIANVPEYEEVSGPLMAALDVLQAAGLEANVRYFPFCMVEEKYRKHLYNFQQLPYDLHEWDYASWSWSGQQNQRMKPGELTDTLTLRQANHWHKLLETHDNYLDDPAVTQEMAARHNGVIRSRECRYRKVGGCEQCALTAICDGFHGDYAELFGADEARPLTDRDPVDDPTHFIRHQVKIVEAEDHAWAL